MYSAQSLVAWGWALYKCNDGSTQEIVLLWRHASHWTKLL